MLFDMRIPRGIIRMSLAETRVRVDGPRTDRSRDCCPTRHDAGALPITLKGTASGPPGTLLRKITTHAPSIKTASAGCHQTGDYCRRQKRQRRRQRIRSFSAHFATLPRRQAGDHARHGRTTVRILQARVAFYRERVTQPSLACKRQVTLKSAATPRSVGPSVGTAR